MVTVTKPDRSYRFEPLSKFVATSGVKCYSLIEMSDKRHLQRVGSRGELASAGLKATTSFPVIPRVSHDHLRALHGSHGVLRIKLEKNPHTAQPAATGQVDATAGRLSAQLGKQPQARRQGR